MTARIPCCVPFCKATFARSKPHDNDEEVICTAHMRPVSTNLMKLHRIAVKRAMEIMGRHPTPDDMSEDQAKEALRLIGAERWLWREIKRKAIEAAQAEGDATLTAALRKMVTTVTVHRNYELEITGNLAPLTRGEEMVAGEGLDCFPPATLVIPFIVKAAA